MFEDPVEFRKHIDDDHKTFNVSIAISLLHSSSSIRIDCTDLQCKICLESVCNLDGLVQHLHRRHGLLNLKADLGVVPFRLERDRWICAVCNKKLRGLMQLFSHTNSHFLKCICDNCGRRFFSHAGLRLHIKCSHAASPYVCRRCFQGFNTYEAKYAHVRSVKACHPFACTKCKERFMFYEARQRHLVAVHGEPKKMYRCTECENIYESRTLLYLHYKVTHSDDHFQCQDCGIKLPTKGDLTKHRVSHTGERNFKCTICEKSFARQTNLKAHYRVHDIVKRYNCSVCSKGFVQSSKFKLHMRSHNMESTI